MEIEENSGSWVLGIETSGDAAGCAIGYIDGVEENSSVESSIAESAKIVSSEEIWEPQKHCENLIPLIKQMLNTLDVLEVNNSALNSADGAELKNFKPDLIAVNVGPGLYTGLRVGIATAMFLAYGWEIKCLPVSSLDLLAFQIHRQQFHRQQIQPLTQLPSQTNAQPSATTIVEAKHSSQIPAQSNNQTDALVMSVIDAKRGEVFYNIFDSPFSETEFLPAELKRGVAQPDELVGLIKNSTTESQATKNILCVGNGAVKYSDTFSSAGFEVRDSNEPLAETLIHFAAQTKNLKTQGTKNINTKTVEIETTDTKNGNIDVKNIIPLDPGELQPIYLRRPDIG